MGDNNTILTRVFTQSTMKSFISEGNDPSILCKVVRRYKIPCDGEISNGEVISEIYNYIGTSYRNEYFYKNTLLNKLLVHVHRLKTTVALTEVPISRSKADFIMINGKAVVYEIKTELDTFERLATQIDDYYKAFDHVCVVASDSQRDELLERFKNSPVGIYTLTKKNTLKRVKEPEEYREKIDLQCIFKILNKPEYESIVLQLQGALPDVTPVKYYRECCRIVCNEPIDRIYPMFLKELKKRNRMDIVDLSEIPDALVFLAYFSKYRKEEFDQLKLFLEKPYVGGSK